MPNAFISFYSTAAWQKTREAYKKYRGGLCESCLARGLIVPGDEVHHRVKLTHENINNPEITLSFDNLMLLCKSCHEEQHAGQRRKRKRYEIDDDGRVHMQDDAATLQK